MQATNQMSTVKVQFFSTKNFSYIKQLIDYKLLLIN